VAVETGKAYGNVLLMRIGNWLLSGRQNTNDGKDTNGEQNLHQQGYANGFLY
jgi:hypothetical protein